MLKINEVFKVQKNKIQTKYKCNILINSKEYKEIAETATYYTIPGILTFYFPEFDDYAQIVLNYNIDLMKSNNLEIEKKNITINYEKDQVVIQKDYYPNDVDIRMIINLLQGRVKYIKDPIILLNMLTTTLPKVDSVHLELIISNMFRSSDDNSKRCRLTGNYKDNIILGQTAQPFEDSWESAMMYRNIDKAINKGLINKQPTEENPIEKIANEKFDF
jgi:hypothetical protein